jgi:hypothetical protein
MLAVLVAVVAAAVWPILITVVIMFFLGLIGVLRPRIRRYTTLFPVKNTDLVLLPGFVGLGPIPAHLFQKGSISPSCSFPRQTEQRLEVERQHDKTTTRSPIFLQFRQHALRRPGRIIQQCKSFPSTPAVLTATARWCHGVSLLYRRCTWLSLFCSFESQSRGSVKVTFGDGTVG